MPGLSLEPAAELSLDGARPASVSASDDRGTADRDHRQFPGLELPDFRLRRKPEVVSLSSPDVASDEFLVAASFKGTHCLTFL